MALLARFDPQMAGLEFEPIPAASSLKTMDRSSMSPLLPDGWYAVSVNLLRGYPVASGNQANDAHEPQDYRYFLPLEPVAMAGYSIYIYQINDLTRPIILSRVEE